MKSSYRKLKDENKSLMHDIKMMVLYPETEEGIDTYIKWKQKYDEDKLNGRQKRK